MIPLISVLLAVGLVCSSETTNSKFSYDDLDSWPQQCSIGDLQSPIDLSTSRSLNYCDYNKVSIGFQDGATLLEQLPGSISLDMRQHSSIMSVVDYDRTLIEYLGEATSFHIPSQHTIDSKRFDMELHLVHSVFQMAPNSHSAKYNKCILAFLFSIDDTATNNTIDKLIDISHQHPSTVVNFDMVFTSLVQSASMFHYRGSLTVPPCTENINWYVLEKPLPVRTEQLEYIRKFINSGRNNSRAVQEQGSRPLYRFKSDCNLNLELKSLAILAHGHWLASTLVLLLLTMTTLF